MSSSRLLISNEVAVDRVAQPAFERPPGLGRGLGFAEFALVELPASALGADLAERDQVHGAAELTVPRSGKPVAALLAEQLGEDANHAWTAFGPTNVAIHRVSAAASAIGAMSGRTICG